MGNGMAQQNEVSLFEQIRTLAIAKKFSVNEEVKALSELVCCHLWRAKLKLVEAELVAAQKTLAQVRLGVNRLGRRLAKVNRLGPMTDGELRSEFRLMRDAFKQEPETSSSVLKGTCAIRE
jgi:hypothetical protein